jgi:hypothetical protein
MRMPHQSKPVSRTAGEVVARGNITPQFNYFGCLLCIQSCWKYPSPFCFLRCSSPFACGI